MIISQKENPAQKSIKLPSRADAFVQNRGMKCNIGIPHSCYSASAAFVLSS